MIVAIAGGPRTGKTTLATELALRSGTAVLHTDALIWLGWSQASQAVAAAILTARGDLIVEGVAVARALRKALDQADGRPVDRLMVLEGARVTLTDGQAAMAKGCRTVLAGILAELVARGVELVDGDGQPLVVP